MKKIKNIIFIIYFTTLIGFSTTCLALENFEYTNIIKKHLETNLPQDYNYIFTIVPRGIVISIDSTVFFENEQDIIKENAKELLNKIGDLIIQINKPCVIEGNAEKTQTLLKEYKNNWELSIARAESIANYLIKIKNINPNNISAIGFGEIKPTPKYETQQKTLNRIDFVLLNYDEQLDLYNSLLHSR